MFGWFRYLRVQARPVLFALFLGGCAATHVAPPSLERYSIISLRPDQIAAVQHGVKLLLSDPESARFGLMVAGRDRMGAITVCGLVNAKNGSGGYTGEKPYMGLLATNKPAFFATGLDAAPDIAQKTEKACTDHGLALR
jgi:hypothetical protein